MSTQGTLRPPDAVASVTFAGEKAQMFGRAQRNREFTSLLAETMRKLADGATGVAPCLFTDKEHVDALARAQDNLELQQLLDEVVEQLVDRDSPKSDVQVIL